LIRTYGRIGHVLEQVVRAAGWNRLALSRAAITDVNLSELEKRLARDHDCVVLVNPNSPTAGSTLFPPGGWKGFCGRRAHTTKFWIDETYIDYAGPAQFAGTIRRPFRKRRDLQIMSKVYA